METKHTGGEWRAIETKDRIIEIRSNQGLILAEIELDPSPHKPYHYLRPLNKVARANAKLIETAPELLEFIKRHYRFLNLEDQKKAEILIKKAIER